MSTRGCFCRVHRPVLFPPEPLFPSSFGDLSHESILLQEIESLLELEAEELVPLPQGEMGSTFLSSGRRGMETHSGLQGTEQVNLLPEVQNGNSVVQYLITRFRQLIHSPRSQSGLLSYRRSSGTQEIPEICGWSTALTIQSSSPWALDGTKSICQRTVSGSC